MNSLLFEELTEHAGFRLQTFELYNWGTFDNHVVHLDLGGENSLLTGGNGSGKTTIVDALLTLIVPQEYLSYNISSGKDGKDGRTLESYVRGAWSTHKDEEQFSVSRDYLRDTSTHTILLGTFTNSGSQKPLTLLQIHYYSQGGTMQHIYAIIDEGVTIRDLQAAAGVFNPANVRTFKSNISQRYGQDVKFYDTFKSYSIVFAERVGFRSREKALKIFAKTVGMKDLSNLNEFIRNHMLDDVDYEGEYRKLNDSYENLHNTQIEIEKDDEQLRQLKRILGEGNRWNTLSLDYSKIDGDIDRCESWRSWQAQQYLAHQIDGAKHERALLLADLELNRSTAAQLQERKENLRAQLSGNSRYQQLQELETQRRALQQTLSERKTRLERYTQYCNALHMDVPTDSQEFESQQFALGARCDQLKNSIESMQDNLYVTNQRISDLKSQLRTTLDQIEAIKGRDSNIPLPYLQLRSKLAQYLHVPETDIPFVGELMQVSEDAELWRREIELTLHDMALTLLVPIAFKNKTTAWFWNNPTPLDISVAAVPSEQFLDDTHEYDEQRLCDAVMTKEGHPYSSWVSHSLQMRFAHLHVDTLEELQGSELSFSETLIHKNGMVTTAMAVPASQSDIYILGWDTARKREQLYADKDDLMASIGELEKACKEDTRHLEQTQQRLETSNALRYSVSSFSEIDVQTLADRDEELANDIALLERDMQDIAQVKLDFQQCEAQLRSCISDGEQMRERLGSVNSKVEMYEHQLQYRQSLLSEEDIKAMQPLLEDFASRHTLSNAWPSLELMDSAAQRLRQELEAQRQAVGNDMQGAKERCINLMAALCKPNQETLAKYPNWTSNLLELGTDSFSIQDIPSFREVHDHLVKDDLPRHKEQFKAYRTSLIGKDVISFNTILQNWMRLINSNIVDLNTSLQRINYSQDMLGEKTTHIRIRKEGNSDDLVRRFKTLLRNAMPKPVADATIGSAQRQDLQDAFFKQVEALLRFLRDEDVRRRVMDVRRWSTFAAEEYDGNTDAQLRYYQDSAGISGGQKAKLAYTIFAAAIAKQFDVFSDEHATRSFRFVLIDEAFSKIDDENSRYAMQLFSQLNLQLMVITPMDKGNLVLPYIKSIQVTECPDGMHSQVVSVQVQDFDQCK